MLRGSILLTVLLVLAIGAATRALAAPPAAKPDKAKTAPAGTPAENLAKAKDEIGASHSYSADALLQQVIDADDASRAQAEEALYLQGMIYYGDVFGATLVLPSVTAVAQKANPFGSEVSKQLLLARRAFAKAAGRYLDITAGGSRMAKVQVPLPALAEDDVSKLQATLSNRSAVQALLDGYEADPAAGKGLLARANQFGMFLGFAGAIPKGKDRKLGEIQAQLKAGASFDPLRHLDWMASVSLDMMKLVKDPQGPDMLALAKRADERLLQLAGDKSDSQFAKNAKARLAKYATP